MRHKIIGDTKMSERKCVYFVERKTFEECEILFAFSSKKEALEYIKEKYEEFAESSEYALFKNSTEENFLRVHKSTLTPTKFSIKMKFIREE